MSRRRTLLDPRRTLGVATLLLGGAGLVACSSSAANPPPTTAHSSTTEAVPPPSGPAPTNALQTVQTWFTEVNAKNRSSVNLLAQPYRRDWEHTRATVWPQFSNVACTTQSQTSTTATIHCTLAETRYAGETHPPTYWNLTLTSQPNGTWLITHYQSG